MQLCWPPACLSLDMHAAREGRGPGREEEEGEYARSYITFLRFCGGGGRGGRLLARFVTALYLSLVPLGLT